MIAQDMCDIGISLAEADDEGEEVADRAAGAAGADGEPQRAETGAADEIDDVEW